MRKVCAIFVILCCSSYVISTAEELSWENVTKQIVKRQLLIKHQWIQQQSKVEYYQQLQQPQLQQPQLQQPNGQQSQWQQSQWQQPQLQQPQLQQPNGQQSQWQQPQLQQPNGQQLQLQQPQLQQPIWQPPQWQPPQWQQPNGQQPQLQPPQCQPPQWLPPNDQQPNGQQSQLQQPNGQQSQWQPPQLQQPIWQPPQWQPPQWQQPNGQQPQLQPPQLQPPQLQPPQWQQPNDQQLQCQEPLWQHAAGSPANPSEFTFMAALGWTSTYGSDYIYLCGGVLIEPAFVLTAAHCETYNGLAPEVVRLGNLPLNETLPFDIFNIKRFITHPGYNKNDKYNDIAVIELEAPALPTNIQIWQHDTYPSKKVYAAGYGKTSPSGPSSNILIRADLFLTNNKECSRFYPNDPNVRHGILESQVCAVDPINRTDTCQEDSGGPLILKRRKYYWSEPVSYLVGLTSLGKDCGSGAPGIYTKVAYYINWIRNITDPPETRLFDPNDEH